VYPAQGPQMQQQIEQGRRPVYCSIVIQKSQPISHYDGGDFTKDDRMHYQDVVDSTQATQLANESFLELSVLRHPY
jgi:hypothetical protein